MMMGRFCFLACLFLPVSKNVFTCNKKGVFKLLRRHQAIRQERDKGIMVDTMCIDEMMKAQGVV